MLTAVAYLQVLEFSWMSQSKLPTLAGVDTLYKNIWLEIAW